MHLPTLNERRVRDTIRENYNVTSIQTLTTQRQSNSYLPIRVIKVLMILPVEELLIK